MWSDPTSNVAIFNLNFLSFPPQKCLSFLCFHTNNLYIKIHIMKTTSQKHHKGEHDEVKKVGILLCYPPNINLFIIFYLQNWSSPNYTTHIKIWKSYYQKLACYGRMNKNEENLYIFYFLFCHFLVELSTTEIDIRNTKFQPA